MLLKGRIVVGFGIVIVLLSQLGAAQSWTQLGQAGRRSARTGHRAGGGCGRTRLIGHKADRYDGRGEQFKRVDRIERTREQKANPGPNLPEIDATMRCALSARGGRHFTLSSPAVGRSRSAIPQGARPDAPSSSPQAAVLPSCRTALKRQRSQT